MAIKTSIFIFFFLFFCFGVSSSVWAVPSVTYSTSVEWNGNGPGDSITFGDATNNFTVTHYPIVDDSVLPYSNGAIGTFARTAFNGSSGVTIPAGTTVRLYITQSQPTAGVDYLEATISGTMFSNSSSVVIDWNIKNVAQIGNVKYFNPDFIRITPNVPASKAMVVDYASPIVTLVNAVSPSGTVLAGTDLTYTRTLTNDGTKDVFDLWFFDPIPNDTDYKVGSASASLVSTGLTATITFSNDNGATYTYTPVSGAGGALAGYDRLVTHIRFFFSGTLTAYSNNVGSFSMVARIR
jgi:uncharacterized repeat protein (TIGR01451 family)